MTRLIATDLDGTLLRSDLSVSSRTRAAFEQAHAAGIQTVIVTARPPRTVQAIARDVGLGGLALCSNGALVYDLDREVTVRSAPLQDDRLREVIATLRAAIPGVCFGLEWGHAMGCESEYAATRPSNLSLDHELLQLDALALVGRAPTLKLMARHPTLTPDDLLAALHELKLAGIHATHSGAPFVELHAPHVTKAWALAQLCADLGVQREDVVAFGDAPNDLPMLRWAGRGIAVANAHPQVLAEITDVAPSNNADGVACVLEALFNRSLPA